MVANQRFRKIENNLWLKKHINHRISKKYRSPEQISKRLKIDYPNDKSKWIGKDSIYEYIYSQRKDLVKYLHCKKSFYRRRRGTKIRKNGVKKPKSRELIKPTAEKSAEMIRG